MSDGHRFETCRDKDCARLTCLAYRAGYDDGFDDGLAVGLRTAAAGP